MSSAQRFDLVCKLLPESILSLLIIPSYMVVVISTVQLRIGKDRGYDIDCIILYHGHWFQREI